VPDSVLADQLDLPIVIGGAGDVLRARHWALEITASDAAFATQPAMATLVLTAVCLHVDSLASRGVRRRDVADFLRDLAEETCELARLAASPMQFVRYVALELESVGVADRTALLRALTHQVQMRHPKISSTAALRQNGNKGA
jgi:hypothetical protein